LKEGSEEAGRVVFCGSAQEACEGTHAIALLTEWDEFKQIDFAKVFDQMIKPAYLFDGRNLLDLAKLKEIGFRTFAIGKR
jgi:UDPglucose 6-dehydrogenase